MRQLSKDVEQAGEKALNKVVAAVTKLIEAGKFEIEGNQLPIRPLVYGGDDVTFVCDGRLGLSLAALYLQEFEKQEVADNEDGQNPLRACAGIAIVKSHYPFTRAYELSEALCRKAKKFIQGSNFSALDWHIAASGLLGSISEIREREYLVNIPEHHKPGILAMRPLRLHSCKDEWRNWASFSDVVNKFKTHKDWKDRRNKVIHLREVLRQGSEATKQFLDNYHLNHDLPAFPEEAVTDDLKQRGWIDVDVNGVGRRMCGYFDAIEAIEFFTLLEDETNEHLQPEN